ncbi:coat protein [ssRNA phage SRR7976325_18]|uniref:Coat protein n=1 Tax=ssRNA phage SRR7976325_18 TaxID=2786705 RepID=A0A8S5L1A0_9VIRU|nr:coat protein [ssRNA phage SRR7976325_18]DAD51207.1 TPA_asm: coat protein [ssRNA phage SRR7976325_18]
MQAAAITINDGLATPVARTFNPDSITPALSVFSERSSGVALTFKRLTVATQMASGRTEVNRAKYSVALPVGTTVNGVTSLAYTLRANVEVILPDGCTDAERKDLYAFLTNGLNHASVKAAVRDLDPLY